jgi:hypothetical protein
MSRLRKLCAYGRYILVVSITFPLSPRQESQILLLGCGLEFGGENLAGATFHNNIHLTGYCWARYRLSKRRGKQKHENIGNTTTSVQPTSLYWLIFLRRGWWLQDLVRRLLEPFSSLPPPTSPPAPLDVALTTAIKDLFRVPAGLLSSLEEEPESFEDCPLDPSADEKTKLPCSTNLDIRLKAIGQGNHDFNDLSEIRVDGDADVTPEISVTSPGSAPSRTLIPSHSFNTAGVHPKHASALIRLLYIHSCLNPANDSPHMASLLIPLYSVLLQEVESPDVVHVEADTFWLFEAMVGEFAELEGENGENEWMRRFSERLAWADPELSADLVSLASMPRKSF